MVLLNLSNDGQSERTTTLPDGNEYIIRTTFVDGNNSHWLMDIYDNANNPILLGVVLTCGADLFKGQANKLNGMQCVCGVVYNTNERSEDALGNGLYVMIYAKDETTPLPHKDRFDMMNFIS